MPGLVSARARPIVCRPSGPPTRLLGVLLLARASGPHSRRPEQVDCVRHPPRPPLSERSGGGGWNLYGLIPLLPTPRIGRGGLNCEVDKENHNSDGGDQEYERHKTVVGRVRRDCTPGRVRRGQRGPFRHPESETRNPVKGSRSGTVVESLIGAAHDERVTVPAAPARSSARLLFRLAVIVASVVAAIVGSVLLAKKADGPRARPLRTCCLRAARW